MEFYDRRDFLHEEEVIKNSNEKSEIQEFYANKNIFITGASGFVGTLVLEKLLRTCRNVNKIYVLFRSSKRKSLDERLRDYFGDEIFDRMKFKNPNYSQQVQILEGDLTEYEFGLSDIDKLELIKNTQIILHIAATVKFDEPLEVAYNINVKGTKTVIQFAELMKNLQSFVYVSTAYSHCDKMHIEECFYDPVFHDKEVVDIIENIRSDELSILTPIILQDKPNTYIFTKSVAEHLFQNITHLPVCIVRPSIIMPTIKDPIHLWTRPGNSVLTLMAAGGIGLIRVFYFCSSVKVDLVPGDISANCILAAAWNRATDKDFPKIYNNVGIENPITAGEFIYSSTQYLKKSRESVSKQVWKSHFLEVHNIYLLYFLYYFLHVLPGLFFATIENYMGRKPIIMKIYRQTFFLNAIIRYFSFKEWSYSNDNTKSLLNRLNFKDRELFNFDMKSFSWPSYISVLYRSTSKYIIKDYCMYPKEVYKEKMRFIAPIDKGIILSFKFFCIYVAFKILNTVFSFLCSCT